MNPPNPISSSFAMPDVTVKRKRGRPRKDRSQIPVKSTFVPHHMDQNQHHGGGESAPIPPGFEEVNGSQQPPPVDTINNSKEDSAVGQLVTGVIEATFDAGYLLSVRIGDSETSLRGVVFKPGHYVPVSAENDVAPSLQMIQRNEVPFPSGNQGRKRRGKEKIDHNSNQLAKARASQLSIVPVQPSHFVGERGTVVPVILQPVSLSNGVIPSVVSPPTISQPAHLAACKSIPPSLIQEATPKGSQTDGGSAPQVCDDLVSAAKKIPPVSAETCNDSGQSSKVLPNVLALTEEQVHDLSKPLLVKPLQAIQNASMPHTFPDRRTGKMTELLMAVQENLMEWQTAESHHQDIKGQEN
ncbi:protein METABOLIC NETWORK MODULATOR 1 [Amaranthus tricolor]|uniref:protein METABOLIC NETWORK MODULATOR 1 n=1 Tax=Amaranthus tricolor TaxID=29722 RepID=UPI002583B742|nr:protein METABOLIC NETWORK MODULATOR 1 [Amaranthus tricolor]